MKIAVLGSGHGGVAMSADLALSGFDVSLGAVEEHSTNIKLIRSMGGIRVERWTAEGKINQFAQPSAVTEDIPSVLKDADIIMAVLPAFAQGVYTDLIIKYGKKGAVVVFPCGGFAALDFYAKLKQNNMQDNFTSCETSSFVYTTKVTGAAKVLIKSVKDNVSFAAAPAEKTDDALLKVNTVYPQFKKAHNVWQTSFSNPSALLHTVPTLMNMSRIELMGPYRYSHYDITPSIARIMEAMDKERLEIAQNLYPNPPSFLETMCKIYNLNCSSIYEVIKSIHAYSVQFSPDNMQHRYITEDIPYSLVPIATIGRKLGIKTPAIDSIINIASLANGEDYWITGRTAEKMGFEDTPKNQAQYTRRNAEVFASL